MTRDLASCGVSQISQNLRISFEKDTHPNTYAKSMTQMCNTRNNVYIQSMKTNPLSVKKLTKNLILRALRQLYTASKIIILIPWVTPPTKVENLPIEFSLFFANSSNLQFFNFSTDVLHCLYICLSFHVLNSIHLLLILQVFLFAK